MKRDAQRRLDDQTAQLIHATYGHPTADKNTVGEWSETWLAGYARRPRTVRQAQVHVTQIEAEFGPMRLSAGRAAVGGSLVDGEAQGRRPG